jgi:tetratricopeptide (TPR) repeat protein
MAVLFHDWDWRLAEGSLEHALELDYNSSYAHLFAAIIASIKLDGATALRELGHALDLDPLNFLSRAQAAECCYWIRDYARAIEYASQTLDLDSSFPRAHFVLGRVYEAQGRIDAAITEYAHAGMITVRSAGVARRALKRFGSAGYHRWALAVRLGAMACPAAIEPRASHGIRERPFFQARNHARLGEIDEAMKLLEESYRERDCLLVLLKAQEWWDPLRGDARFADLLRRVGIPP